MDDVEEALVAGPEEPIGERVRMRVAPVAGDGVDRLDVLGAELEEHLHRVRHDLVLLHARPQHPVDLLVDRIDDAGGVVEQRELVLALQPPCLEHHRLRVDEMEAVALQREQRRHVRDVDSDRLLLEPPLAELGEDHLGERVRNAGRVGHRAAHRRHPGAPVRLRQPRAVELVVLRGRSEVPEDRVVAARKRRAKRMFLSRSHVPIAVLVT